MDSITTRQAPQTLSFAAHVGGALAALAVIAGGAAFAGSASEQAVHSAQASINPAIRYVVLPTVEVIAKRQVGEVAGCAAPQSSI